MKKFISAILAAAALYGCQRIKLVESYLASKPFIAIIDDSYDAQTKTSLDANGNVLWKQNDKISIFAASTINQQYQVTDASDGKTSAELFLIPGGGFVAGTELDNNIAVYPYSQTADIAKNSGGYIISGIRLPATQYYAKNSFSNGAFPMVAVTSNANDYNLKFKNIIGGIKLQLKGTATISSISLTGNAGESLCGITSITTSYGRIPSITLADESEKKDYIELW